MKPFYSVKFNARMCNMRITVNGVPLLGMEVDGQCSSNYPFNHLLLESGLASIKYEIRPLKGATQLSKDAYFSCVVELFILDSRDYQPVSSMAAYETQPLNESVFPFIVHEEVFKVSVPYVMIGWKQSIKLDHFQNRLRTMVFDKYNSIIALMQSHSFAQYEKEFRDRENIMGVCYYLTEDEKRGRMKDVEEVISSCRVSPLTHRDFLEFAAGGRLVRLIREDGESSLRLINELVGEETSIDMWLHMKQGNSELTII